MLPRHQSAHFTKSSERRWYRPGLFRTSRIVTGLSPRSCSRDVGKRGPSRDECAGPTPTLLRKATKREGRHRARQSNGINDVKIDRITGGGLSLPLFAR